MNQSLQILVRSRAGGLCEYCRLPEEFAQPRFEIDHIRSIKHHGPTIETNLALSCFWCNSAKGPNVAGYDPLTGELCPLFNPRTNHWPEHFAWNGPLLVGTTPIGRTTIDVLDINDSERVLLRQMLIDEAEA